MEMTPVTHCVLWMVEFNVELMLTTPLAPPRPSMTGENAEASTMGRFHGNTVSQPRMPRPPRQPACDIGRSADRKDREQRGHRDQSREHGMDELESGANLRISKEMVKTDGHREDQKSGGFKGFS